MTVVALAVPKAGRLVVRLVVHSVAWRAAKKVALTASRSAAHLADYLDLLMVDLTAGEKVAARVDHSAERLVAPWATRLVEQRVDMWVASMADTKVAKSAL